MGTIKIEFDIPEFKDTLEVTLTIKRDGEVVMTSSPSSNSSDNPISGLLRDNKVNINESQNNGIPESMTNLKF
jgi:hypothetical protein